MAQLDTPNWREITSIPNLISLTRLILLPFMVLAIDKSSWFLATLIGFTIAISDSLDGYIARKLRMVTKLGAVLDPLIDRLTIITLLVTLLVNDEVHFIVFFAIIIRDLSILVTRVNRKQTLMLEVVYLGKIGTWFLYVCFVLVFFENIIKNELMSQFTQAGFVWAIIIYWLAGIMYLKKS
ncbi:MAG: hypothetical protein FJW76_06590 [Actinobacteria bacterium]|nr:hypothetical protein [Actinomycetota bacterium]